MSSEGSKLTGARIGGCNNCHLGNTPILVETLEKSVFHGRMPKRRGPFVKALCYETICYKGILCPRIEGQRVPCVLASAGSKSWCGRFFVSCRWSPTNTTTGVTENHNPGHTAHCLWSLPSAPWHSKMAFHLQECRHEPSLLVLSPDSDSDCVRTPPWSK